MTTTAQTTETGDHPASRRPHRLRLFVVALALGLVAVLVATGAGLAAWDASYEARVLPGVTVGGVDLSGLDRAEAAKALTAAYRFDQGRIVLRTPAGDVEIPYSAFGRRPDIDSMLHQAFAMGRAGGLPHRVVDELRQALDGATIQPSLLIDEGALATAIAAAVEPLAFDPVDATVTMGEKGPITTPGRHGRAADAAPAIAAALAAVRRLDAPGEIVIPVGVVQVPPRVDDEDVQAAIARADRMIGNVVVRYGKKTWKIAAAKVRSWVSFTASADGSVRVTVDPARIPASLAKARNAVAKKPQSAVFLRTRSGKVFGVAPGADGLTLDTEETARRVVAELAARVGGAAAAPVNVATAPVTPKLTTEEAKQSAPLMKKLGSWTTYFPISDHNFFGANIWVPARLINGTVLKPGQTFDWWRAVGPVSTARGFGPGGYIRGSYTDPTGALGGGMCSSSTTLFNAALRAGLQMGARDNHKYYIPRYPLGLDATVWILNGAKQSMSFTNDTSHPILIRGIKTRSGSAGYVTYELWGVPDGRKVSLSRPSVTNVVQARTTTEYVDTLRHGAREQVEYPSNQMDVAVTRVVRNATGRVLHQEVWRTHYVLWNGLVQIGR